MQFQFSPGVVAPSDLSSGAIWFAFRGDELIITQDRDGILIPQAQDFDCLGFESEQRHYLGVYQGIHCFAVRVSENGSLPVGYQSSNIRWLLGQCDDAVFQLAGRAKQVLEWDATHQYCGRCGNPMQLHAVDRAKVCLSCGLTQYPRIAPCIICLVSREDEVLLGRSPNFPANMFSTLAGFIEPGESIEEAVHREVFEEVGITLNNLEYFGSQPWPFPNSLMIGFHAQYRDGEILVDGTEIVDARWWKLHDLPLVPPRGSISRLLIDDYLQKKGMLK